MEILKRLVVLQLLFLLFIAPSAFGEITIKLPEKSAYNLGDKILPEVSIREGRDYDGFFSLHIYCDKYDLQYYTIPLNVEADFRTQVSVPELPLSKPMTGKCSLRSNFEAIDGKSIDNSQSERFSVTDELKINVDGTLEAKPGEDFVISGRVKKYDNEALPKGEAEITYGNEKANADITLGEFKHAIHLSNNAKSGTMPLAITAKDKYGNYGDIVLDFVVIPILTRIENRIENDVLMPGDVLKARIVLYDHNNEVISGNRVDIKILSPDEKLLAENYIESLNYLEFKIK